MNKRPPTAQEYRLRQTGETGKRGGSKLEGQEINLARAGKQQQRYWTAGEGTAAGGASKMLAGKTTTGKRSCSSAKIRNSRKNNLSALASKLD